MWACMSLVRWLRGLASELEASDKNTNQGFVLNVLTSSLACADVSIWAPLVTISRWHLEAVMDFCKGKILWNFCGDRSFLPIRDSSFFVVFSFSKYKPFQSLWVKNDTFIILLQLWWCILVQPFDTRVVPFTGIVWQNHLHVSYQCPFLFTFCLCEKPVAHSEMERSGADLCELLKTTSSIKSEEKWLIKALSVQN